MKKKKSTPQGTLIISDNESAPNILLQLQVLEEANISITSNIQDSIKQMQSIRELLGRISR